MKTRRSFLLILCCVLSGLVVACGSTTSTSEVIATVSETKPEEAQEEKPSNQVEVQVSSPTSTPTLSVPILEVYPGRDFISYDYFHIVGEVKNNTNSWMDFVQIAATLYDESGNILGTDFTYLMQDMLAPNSTGVFDLLSNVGGKASSVASYKLQVQGRESENPPYQDLELIVGEGYSSYGYFHLPGEVKNTGSKNCEFTQIVAGFYNSEGKVVAADFTYSSLDQVLAGSSSPFELLIDNLEGEFDSYKLWVDCNPEE